MLAGEMTTTAEAYGDHNQGLLSQLNQHFHRIRADSFSTCSSSDPSYDYPAPAKPRYYEMQPVVTKPPTFSISPPQPVRTTSLQQNTENRKYSKAEKSKEDSNDEYINCFPYIRKKDGRFCCPFYTKVG